MDPEDVTNSAMAPDCITTVSEDFFTKMINLEWLFQWKAGSLLLKRYMEYCLSINSDYKFGINLDQKKLPPKISYTKFLPII